MPRLVLSADVLSLCSASPVQIDINQDDPEAHTTEVSRFKNVLVRLKNDPLPAAAAE